MITKKDIENTEIISNIKILRKSIKYVIKISKEIGFDYNQLLQAFGIGEQKHSQKLKAVAVAWNSLKDHQKKTIKEWSTLTTKNKRKRIEKEQGIISDSEIDKQLIIFNGVVDSFTGFTFEEIEECSNFLTSLETAINPANLVLELMKVYDNEYNDELDEVGALFKELVRLIHLATNKKYSEEELINCDYKLLIELFIRIFLKPNDEVNTSFFIEKAVHLLMKNFNGLQSIKK